MPSLSFDSVAHLYDATRGYPAEVARQIVEAIVDTADATPQTRFMEVGVGTGRIAFPLASLGHIYTGVDISEKMVEHLEAKLVGDGWKEDEQAWGGMADENSAETCVVRRFTSSEKQASMRLVMADMTRLPFYDASFDSVIAVHVFHLVDGWQQAVSEVLRVLRPGGLFLHCWDEYMISDRLVVESEWQKIVRELGGEVNRPGVHSRFSIIQWLRERGLQPQEFAVARWESMSTPRQAVEHVRKRIWSSTWVVPDDLFAASAERLWRWADNYFGAAMDTPHAQTRQFVICKTGV